MNVAQHCFELPIDCKNIFQSVDSCTYQEEGSFRNAYGIETLFMRTHNLIASLQNSEEKHCYDLSKRGFQIGNDVSISAQEYQPIHLGLNSVILYFSECCRGQGA